MYWEKRYVIAMTFCLAFLVFIMTPVGDRVIGRMMTFGIKVHRTKVGYFEKIEMDDIAYDKRGIRFLEDMNDNPMQDAVLFSNKDREPMTLKGSLIIHSKKDMLKLSQEPMFEFINYTYERVVEGKGKGEYHSLDFRLGLDKTQRCRLLMEKDYNSLSISQSYDATFGFNTIGGKGLEDIEKEAVDALDFVYLLEINKVPFVDNHLIAKAYVDGQLNYSQKKAFESLLKDKTGFEKTSIIYNRRGTVVDRTISEDPMLKAILLENATFICQYDLDALNDKIKDILNP
jgi:hypothetical protein